MEDGALEGIAAEDQVVPVSKVKELEARIKSLERVLGRKTEENEILNEAVRIATVFTSRLFSRTTVRARTVFFRGQSQECLS